MKNCPYCGQQNPEENQFCNKCGRDMVKFSVPESVYIDHPRPSTVQSITSRNEAFIQSALDKGSVKFVLYLHCILAPLIGLILGLLVSITPFQRQKELSSKLITCACVATIVWIIIECIVGFIVGFIIGRASAF